MPVKYTVSLAKLLKELQFDVLYMPKDPSDILISSLDVHRPGLVLAGFDDFFDSARVNFIGKAEVEYINEFDLTDGEYILEIIKGDVLFKQEGNVSAQLSFSLDNENKLSE